MRNRLRGSSEPEPAAPQPPAARVDIDAQAPSADPDAVDVDDLLTKYSVEELSEAADDYYRRNIEGIDYYLGKPASSSDEAPQLLSCFAQILAGVRVVPGMRVLDFGAGTGWTSRFLTQMGCEVIVCDVSPTALDIARRLFERQPVSGSQPVPTFLRFDGRRIDLADESVDRVICIDAFHHVPNPADVLHELGRVLRQGGIAAFQEPGPNHSKSAQSQFEMKNFTVIENDIRMRDISTWADRAGFTQLELAVFTPMSFRLSIDEYEDYLARGVTVERHYEHQRQFVADQRVFFLSKGEPLISDSRDRSGLLAELAVSPDEIAGLQGGAIRARLTARNIGTSLWLPSDAPVGPVFVGAHLYDADGRMLERDYARIPLPSAGPGIAPGEEVTLDLELPVPIEPGSYTIELDLVAEYVGWFEMNDSRPATIRLEVE